MSIFPLLPLALIPLALGAGSIIARHSPSVTRIPQVRPQLVIAQERGDFVIRDKVIPSPQNLGFPDRAIPLGDTVRIDRNALIPTSAKDISHGETR